MTFSGWDFVITALLGIILPSFTLAAINHGDINVLCDPSKLNFGCSPFARCNTTLLRCECNPGFLGDGQNCQSFCMDQNQTCASYGASCVDIPSTTPTKHSCICKDGYKWSAGGMKCIDIDYCEVEGNCLPYSTCKNVPGGYTCECCYSSEGWKGVSGFGYLGDGKTRCYPDSILDYGKSDYAQKLQDGDSLHSKIPGGFPFYGELYYDIYTHLNGFITFETKTAPYLGGDTKFPTYRNIRFIAPFWTDLEASSEPGSGLYVDAYTLFKPYTSSGDHIQRIFTKTRGFVGEINITDFKPTIILTATWANMTASGKFAPNQKMRITFQSVLVTNGTHSFGFISYAENPKDSEWDAPLDNVYIGMSGDILDVGNRPAIRQPVKQFPELFRDPPDLSNVCQKMTFLTQRGRFYKVFGPPFEAKNSSACLDEASRQGLKHGDFGVESEDPEGNLLPPELYCPCLEQQAYTDKRFVLSQLEPAPVTFPPLGDRHSCHLSRFFKPIHRASKDYRARAYCCYDSQGALVTKGAAAGAIVPEGYEADVIQLKKYCCFNSDLCHVFHKMYAPVTCHRYERPGMAYLRGAGHFNTINQTEYTFNGRGEYTYLSLKRLGPVTVQVRMVNETFETHATSFVTAMVAKCKVPATPNATMEFVEHKAEVRVNKSRQLELLIDGNMTESGAFGQEMKNMFVVGCNSTDCEITCKYQKIVISFQVHLQYHYLHMNTMVPLGPEFMLFGLIGDSDGELLFESEAGEEKVADLNNVTQIAEFAEFYRVKKAESLFTYTGAEPWETYNKNDTVFVPTYWSDVAPTINGETMDDLCFCQGDHACKFDKLVTGRQEIGFATHQAGQSLTMDRSNFAARTPQWELDPDLVFDIRRNYTGNLRDFIKYDEMHIHTDNPIPMIPDGFKVITNLYPYLYKIDEIAGIFSLNISEQPITFRENKFYLKIYAYKRAENNIVAASSYTPDIFVCACDQWEQCDFTYIYNRTAIYRPSIVEEYYVLPCNCPVNAVPPFCDQTVEDVCANNKPCDKNAFCTRNISSPSGYSCKCTEGYSGNGLICTINGCPEENNCSQICNLDPTTVAPVCSCKHGYVMDEDGKTCRDIDECNFPKACPDPKNICVNIEGSHYCECEAGYKPKIGMHRLGCLKADRTYIGSFSFELYWDTLTLSWQGWSDDLSKRDSILFTKASRELEVLIERLIKLVEPTETNMFTYVYKFSNVGNKTTVSYKIYPDHEIKSGVALLGLKRYILALSGEAAGFKGLEFASVTLNELKVEDFCSTSPCPSPFTTCHNGDTEKKCQCKAGFIISDSADLCISSCKVKKCDKNTSHSCRDLPDIGPQCLCKKGYELDANNNCYRKHPCSIDTNLCGINAQCNEHDDDTYTCTCDEGHVKSANPSLDICIPDVIFFRGSDQHEYPEKVVLTESNDYLKVAIPVGIPYFGTKQWKLFIGANGVISFDKPLTPSEHGTFHPSTFGYVVAPLWSDFVVDMSKVKVHVFDATTSTLTPGWSKVIEEISKAIDIAQSAYPFFNMFGYPTPTASFQPKTIVAVTWNNLTLKPFIDVDRVTMQVVIASDGIATIVMSNYDASTTTINTWEDPVAQDNPELAYYHRGFVGFQEGERIVCLNRTGFGEQQSECRNFLPSELFFKSKESYSLPLGRHVFLVANDASVTTQNERACFNTIQKIEGIIDIAELNYIYSSIEMKPWDFCPWTETQLDSRFQKATTLDDRTCYLRKFWSSAFYLDRKDHSPKYTDVRPYCCYKYNALLTQATSTSHIMIQNYTTLQDDILNACCINVSHCPLAVSYAPPEIVTNGYEPPVTAGAFGDPHMVTFAGFNVTFKGRGDYVLFNSTEILLQGRFNGISVNGSALTGAAWRVETYEKVAAEISTDGKLSFSVGGQLLNLTDAAFINPQEFDKNGHIESKLDEDRTSVRAVKVTYIDGLSFELLKMASSSNKEFYLHLRIKMPKSYLSSHQTSMGLLADFVYPDGSIYKPKIYFDNRLIGDKHYFYDYGRNWTVSNAHLASLFETASPDDGYIPPLFYESYLENVPKDRPIFDGICNKSLPCAYDYVSTNGDEAIAFATLTESILLHKLRREEGEKPPTFSKNPDTWSVNVNKMFAKFKPTISDLSPDVTFRLETNFPRHLISEFDPYSGRILVVMIAEARDTLLYNGPFKFDIVATRGSTGVSTYSPIAIRICNCANDSACDPSIDEADGEKVEVFPIENNQRYQVVRCNCLAHQTGKFCDSEYNPCATSPCYPTVSCFPYSLPDRSSSFLCGVCPAGHSGNGVHCKIDRPCVGVFCDDGKVCKDIDGHGKCVCPGGTNDDGSCQYDDRCQQFPSVCIGNGQICNSGDLGKYWCDCRLGYAPRYDLDGETLDVKACESTAYTYVGSITFDKHYDTNKDLETFIPPLGHPETIVYGTFARQILFELMNVYRLLNISISNLSVRNIRQVKDGNGFIVDYLAFSSERFVIHAVQSAIATYAGQTSSIGAIIDIHIDSIKFIDICDSIDYSPCRDISQISICYQTGSPGDGPTCKCNATLGYETAKRDNGDYSCPDVCDTICRNYDENAQQCNRENSTAMYQCSCTGGESLYFNNTINKCVDMSQVCTPGICGPNADCTPVDPNNYKCNCVSGYQFGRDGKTCITNCQHASGFCIHVTNSYGCKNVDSGYQCLCNAGYKWDNSSRSCVDIDECADEEDQPKCKKPAECVNVVGSYICRCSDDYVTVNSSQTCYAKREKILYPYNFANSKPIRDADAVENFTIRAGFIYEYETFYSVKIGFDGFIGLEVAPPFKYFGLDISNHVIAPFWMDLDVLENDPTSGLYIDFFDSTYPLTSDELRKWEAPFNWSVSHFGDMYPDDVNKHPFLKKSPDAMFILTWVNVTPAPASEYGKSFYTTFQAILSIYSGFSYATFNYLEDPADTQWPTKIKAPHLQPYVGFTIPGSGDGKLVQFYPPDIDPPDFYKVFEAATGAELRGRIVGKFGTPSDIRTRDCYFAYRNYPQKLVDILHSLNKPGSGVERHACPAFLKQMELDGRWQPETEPTTFICYGGKFWNIVSDNDNLTKYRVRSICCYDLASGSFLAFPHAHVTSFIQVQEYHAVQDNLFKICCNDLPYCEMFADKNEATLIAQDYYAQPVVAYIRGDPHIGMPIHKSVTSDRQLTFNGRGEYTLIKPLGADGSAKFGSLNAQIRLGIRKEISNVATFITGVAFKAHNDSDVVEVIHDGGSVHVLKNGVELDIASLVPSGIKDDAFDETSYSLWADLDHHIIGYATGFGIAFHIHDSENKAGYFHVRVSLPQAFSELISRETCGLLTSYDSSPFVDCNYQSATDDVWKNESNAYNFGQRFKLKSKAESIFSYKIGPPFDDVNTVPNGWMPMFLSDILGYPDDLTNVCGTDVDMGCKYDYGTTLNDSIAHDTREFGKLILKAYNFSTLIRPQIIDNYFDKIFLPFFNIGASFTVVPSVNPESAHNLHYELGTNLDPSWYQFDNKTGRCVITASLQLRNGVRGMTAAPYLHFVAINDDHSPALWTPSLWSCVCEKSEQCDFEYMERPYLARAHHLNHNYLLRCICPPTTRGKFCERPFDPCCQKPCGDLAQCSLNETSPLGFSCSHCSPGFIMSNDGICKQHVCRDDRCVQGFCEVSPKNGLPMCVCNRGYELSPTNDTICQDIDECRLGTHDCYQYGVGMKCINKPGSWICGCKTGYGFNSDDNVCDKAEYQVHAQLKVQSLIVGIKQLTWSSELGDIRSDLFNQTARKAEQYLRVWFRDDLRYLSAWSITVNKFLPGSILVDYYVSFSRVVNITELVNVQKAFFKNHGTIAGMIGASSDSIFISEIDHCQDETKCDPLSAKCRWDPILSQTRCDCLDGFVKIDQSEISCADNCTNICLDQIGPNSVCTRGRNNSVSFSCDCLPGFTKDAQEGRCKARNACEPSPCKNNGTCGILSNDQYICHCPENFMGNNCQLECQCQNGVCPDKSNPNFCRCFIGYTGPRCESPIASTTTGTPVKEPIDETQLIAVGAGLGVVSFGLICALAVFIYCFVRERRRNKFTTISMDNIVDYMSENENLAIVNPNANVNPKPRGRPAETSFSEGATEPANPPN